MNDLELAVSLARAAGAAIEAVRLRGFLTRDKADHSPVTEADLAADGIIAAGLARARPADAILSEESLTALPSPAQSLWCVDPLDGTEAFVDGATHDRYVRGYAVQIARLEPGPDGYRITLGVTYEPRVDELFYAVRGQGTFRVVHGVETGPLRCAPVLTPRLVTSTRVDLQLKGRLLASGYLDAGALRSVGVKVGRLVCGDADVYPATHSLSWWDLAAPQIILEEAGGRVSDLHGQAPHYPHPFHGRPVLAGPLLLSTGHFHVQAMSDLRG